MLQFISTSADARSAALPVISELLHPRMIPAVVRELAEASFAVRSGLHGSAAIVDDLEVPHEHQPFAALSPIKLDYTAIYTSFFYRLTRSTHDPKPAEDITARIVALVWVSDYIVDDFAFPADLKLEVLQSLATTVKEGVEFEYDFCNELTALSSVTARLHDNLRNAPQGHLVIEALDTLCRSACEQITEPPSIARAEQLGANSFEAVARVQFAFNPEAPERVLPATRAFGSILQLIDDLWDRERDKAHGITTFATIAPDRAALKAQIAQRIEALGEEMVRPLTASEARQFRAMLGLSAGYFTAKEHFKAARKWWRQK